MNFVHRTQLLILGGLLMTRAPTCGPAVDAESGIVERSVHSGFAGLPYDLDKPDAVFELPKELREISGLAVVGDSVLVAVQDEHGTLYGLSLDGVVIWEDRFWKEGDFEAVEVVGDSVYVARSDGNLFVRALTDDGKGRQIKTRLSSKDDIEGLAWIPEEAGVLIVAAKERTGKGGTRELFAFDRMTGSVGQDPWATLSLDSIASALDVSGKSARQFKPSGMAVDPISGMIYVVSSVLQSVAVLDGSGKFVGAVRLDKRTFPQPEGIALRSNGDLYLSSEGGRRGVLAKFHRVAGRD